MDIRPEGVIQQFSRHSRPVPYLSYILHMVGYAFIIVASVKICHFNSPPSKVISCI